MEARRNEGTVGGQGGETLRPREGDFKIEEQEARIVPIFRNVSLSSAKFKAESPKGGPTVHTRLISSSDVTTRRWAVRHDIVHFSTLQFYLWPATQPFRYLCTHQLTQTPGTY